MRLTFFVSLASLAFVFCPCSVLANSWSLKAGVHYSADQVDSQLPFAPSGCNSIRATYVYVYEGGGAVSAGFVRLNGSWFFSLQGDDQYYNSVADFQNVLILI